jgi:hypothetical protein
MADCHIGGAAAGPQVALAASQTFPGAQSASDAHAARHVMLSVVLQASWLGQAASPIAQLPPPSQVPAVSVAPVQLGVPQLVAPSG